MLDVGLQLAKALAAVLGFGRGLFDGDLLFFMHLLCLFGVEPATIEDVLAELVAWHGGVTACVGASDFLHLTDVVLLEAGEGAFLVLALNGTILAVPSVSAKVTGGHAPGAAIVCMSAVDDAIGAGVDVSLEVSSADHFITSLMFTLDQSGEAEGVMGGGIFFVGHSSSIALLNCEVIAIVAWAADGDRVQDALGGDVGVQGCFGNRGTTLWASAFTPWSQPRLQAFAAEGMSTIGIGADWARLDWVCKRAHTNRTS